MKTFKPGDRVRLVAGIRVGTITTVTSELWKTHLPTVPIASIPAGTMVHSLDLPPLDGTGVGTVVAPPAWLEPYWEGREPVAWNEELRNLCGIGSKAKEDA